MIVDGQPRWTVSTQWCKRSDQPKTERLETMMQGWYCVELKACGGSKQFQANWLQKAGTTAKGQNLLANISTSRTSLLQGQYLIQEK